MPKKLTWYTASVPLTAEDLAILDTPDVELQRKAEVFSFDQELFKTRISTGDRWQQLLQAHLYYDHVITQLLIDILENPEAINAKRLAFSQKLQLVQALGLLPAEIVASVKHINDIRNGIAHNLNFEITDKGERDLANCIPKYLRENMELDKDREPGPVRFHELLFVVLIQIEQIRQDKTFDRLKEQKEKAGLRRSMQALTETAGRIRQMGPRSDLS